MSGLCYAIQLLSAGSTSIVRDINFAVDDGRAMAIVGESGAGKTMLAMSMLGLLPPNVHAQALTIRIGDENVTPRTGRKHSLAGSAVAYIPQSGLDALNPMETIAQHFDESCRKQRIPRNKWRTLAEASLARVGLDPAEVMHKYPFEISGGMAQKVILALTNPEQARVVIADEPTNGLDPDGRDAYIAELFGMFRHAVKLIITHDISLAGACDDVLVLCGGTAVEHGTARQVLTETRHPYTRSLLNSLPEQGLTAYPVLRSGASACPFYRRCTEVCADCLNGTIPVCRGEDGHEWRCVHAAR